MVLELLGRIALANVSQVGRLCQEAAVQPAIARDFLSLLRLWHERSKDDPL